MKTVPDGEELYIPPLIDQPTILDINQVQQAGGDFITLAETIDTVVDYSVIIFDSSGNEVGFSFITEESYNSYQNEGTIVELVGQYHLL